MIINHPIEFQELTALYVIDNLFNEKELIDLRKYSKTLELEKGRDKSNRLVRKSNVSFFSKDEQNCWIFDKINYFIQFINDRHYGIKLNGYSTIQYTSYDVGDKYDYHIDTFLGPKNLQNISDLGTRKLSVSILLNDDFEGGDFEFFTGETNTVKMTAGQAIVFPSFLVHRVKEITKGRRESLVVWVVGPKFK